MCSNTTTTLKSPDQIRSRTNLPVFSEFDVEHVGLEVQLAKRSVLDVVPQNQPVAWVAGVVSSANKSNDVGSEQHFADFDSSLEI